MTYSSMLVPQGSFRSVDFLKDLLLFLRDLVLKANNKWFRISDLHCTKSGDLKAWNIEGKILVLNLCWTQAELM